MNCLQYNLISLSCGHITSLSVLTSLAFWIDFSSYTFPDKPNAEDVAWNSVPRDVQIAFGLVSLGDINLVASTLYQEYSAVSGNGYQVRCIKDE